MRALVSFLVLLALLLPAAAFAQDAPPNIVPGPDRITPLHKGDPAPYDGQLFDGGTALRWAGWIEWYRQKQKLDKELSEQICQAQVGLRDKELSLEREQYQKVTEDLQKKLQAASSPPFYERFAFGFGLGVATTVALTIAAAFVIHDATK